MMMSTGAISSIYEAYDESKSCVHVIIMLLLAEDDDDDDDDES